MKKVIHKIKNGQVFILFFMLIVALEGCSNTLNNEDLSNSEMTSESKLNTEDEKHDDSVSLQASSINEDIYRTDNITEESKYIELDTISGNNILEDVSGNSQKDADNSTQKTDNEDDTKEADLIIDYDVTVYEESANMYATGSVNIRSGAGKKYNRLGCLKRGDLVEVTGETSNYWKQIKYGDLVGFVSGKYLQSEQPASIQETVSESVSTTQTNAATETAKVENIQPHAAGIIFVGDSRFVQMHDAIGDDGNVWICQNSKGYDWLESTALQRIYNNVGNGSKIIINLGVNDTGNWKKYAELINANVGAWTDAGATVYYALVGPVWENPYTTDEQVKTFNSSIVGVLSPSVNVLDEYNYLITNSYRVVDGLHYDSNTYLNIYSYYLSSVG